jgi:hypothetical protein
MKPPPSREYTNFKRNVVIGTLVFTAAVAGFFAWMKHQEAQALREQIANAEHAKKGGKKSLRGAEDAGPATDAPMDDGNNGAASSEGKKGKGGKHERADGSQRPKTKDTVGWRAYANLAGNPDYERLSVAQNRALVGRTYGAMFKSLNLPLGTQASLQELLAQRQQAVTDAVVAARENGLKSKTAPEEFSAATQAAIAPLDAQIHQLLGDAAFGQYQRYQATIPEQNLIGQLQEKLSITPTPLADDQATQFLQALAQAKTASDAMLGTHSLLAGGGIAKVTDQTLAIAQSVLAPPQVQALQQIQQERADQMALENLMKGKPSSGSGGGGKKSAGKK